MTQIFALKERKKRVRFSHCWNRWMWASNSKWNYDTMSTKWITDGHAMGSYHEQQTPLNENQRSLQNF